MVREQRQAGFAALEIALIVVVVALIGFTVVSFMNHRQAASTTSPIGSAADTAVVPAPKITSAADLKQASATLDQLDSQADAADSQGLASDVNSF